MRRTLLVSSHSLAMALTALSRDELVIHMPDFNAPTDPRLPDLLASRRTASPGVVAPPVAVLDSLAAFRPESIGESSAVIRLHPGVVAEHAPKLNRLARRRNKWGGR